MLLSIIIPVFNAEKYIRRCLSSVYDNAPELNTFEVIAVNDGSTDRSLELMRSFSNEFSNLRLIEKDNGGVSSARNLGIDSAQGDYVLFLDADDELVDDSLKKVCDYLSSKEDVDMLVTRQIRNNGQREWSVAPPALEEHRIYSGVDAYKEGYVRGNAGGGICRTAFLRFHHLRFPVGVRNSEDALFFIQLQVYAKSIIYYNLNLYRIHEIIGSASRSSFSEVGRAYVETIRAAADIKNSLYGSEEQKAIFDLAVYKVLSDIAYYFASSHDLSYFKLRKSIELKTLLPLDTKHMYRFKSNARLINFSYTLFYFISWLKHLHK